MSLWVTSPEDRYDLALPQMSSSRVGASAAQGLGQTTTSARPQNACMFPPELILQPCGKLPCPSLFPRDHALQSLHQGELSWCMHMIKDSPSAPLSPQVNDVI